MVVVLLVLHHDVLMQQVRRRMAQCHRVRLRQHAGLQRRHALMRQDLLCAVRRHWAGVGHRRRNAATLQLSGRRWCSGEAVGAWAAVRRAAWRVPAHCHLRRGALWLRVWAAVLLVLRQLLGGALTKSVHVRASAATAVAISRGASANYATRAGATAALIRAGCRVAAGTRAAAPAERAVREGATAAAVRRRL
jgi:hypothetical protein